MKHSPLCTRDDGRTVYFTVSHDGAKYRLTLSGAFLDAECGADADEASRKAWVGDRLPDILGVLTARTGGGRVKPPFGDVMVEEIT